MGGYHLWRLRRLLNGQHRLKACVLANMPFDTVIVKGLKTLLSTPSTMERVATWVMYLPSVENTAHMPCIRATLRLGVRYWQFMSKVGSRKTIGTKQLLEKLLDKHQGIRASARLVKALEKRPGGILITPSLAIGLHYLFSLVDAEKSDDFFSTFQSGQSLASGNPILMLRAKLIASTKEATVIKREAMYSYMVMAWNAYVESKPLKRFAFAADGKMVEIAGLPQDLMKGLLD